MYYKPNLAPTLKILIHLDYKTKMIFCFVFSMSSSHVVREMVILVDFSFSKVIVFLEMQKIKHRVLAL